MKILILTSRGLESFVAHEVEQFGGSVSVTLPGIVVGELTDVVRYVYQTRFAIHVMRFVGSFAYTDYEELQALIGKFAWPETKESWTLKVTRDPDTKQKSQHVFDVLKPALAKTQGVFSFKEYVVTYRAHLTADTLFVGAALVDVDLGHRDYRVFLGRDALRGPTASALLDLVGYSNGMTLLDPLCQSGTITIEAALFATHRSSRFFERVKLAQKTRQENALQVFEAEDAKKRSLEGSVFAFDDSFPRLQSAQKNARIADMHNVITFSRQDLNWIDLKCENVDVIVTSPDVLHPKKDEKLMSQCAEVLKNGGRLGIATRQPKRWKTSLELEKELVVYQGKEPWKLLVFRK